jgi:hypothetical protein
MSTPKTLLAKSRMQQLQKCYANHTQNPYYVKNITKEVEEAYKKNLIAITKELQPLYSTAILQIEPLERLIGHLAETTYFNSFNNQNKDNWLTHHFQMLTETLKTLDQCAAQETVDQIKYNLEEAAIKDFSITIIALFAQINRIFNKYSDDSDTSAQQGSFPSKISAKKTNLPSYHIDMQVLSMYLNLIAAYLEIVNYTPESKTSIPKTEIPDLVRSATFDEESFSEAAKQAFEDWLKA